MASDFETTKVHLFDVHTSLKPLLFKKAAPALAFLSDPDAYRRAYAAPATVRTKSFEISPMKPDTIRRHRFWARYCATLTDQPDYFALQMPFICKPAKGAVSLDSGDLKASVGAAVYLFSIGWATNIEFAIEAKATPERLAKLTLDLRSNAKVFRIQGKENSLLDVLRWFSHRITSECYLGFQAADDMVRVPRRIIVAVDGYDGPVQAYDLASDSGMPPGTRAQVHSMLLGKSISSDEVIKSENASPPGFTLTPLRDSDFAITYLDLGTLLFVQDPPHTQAKREALYCLASNIRNFILMANAWLAFAAEISRLLPAQMTPSLAAIQPDLQLRDLKERYRNRLAQAYYRAHQKLQRY